MGGGGVQEGVNVFCRAIHSPAAAAGNVGEEFVECNFSAEIKELNINCAELFSPAVLLPGTASQVQGSHRSPAECAVSITGTSHGAVTREAVTHPLSASLPRL